MGRVVELAAWVIVGVWALSAAALAGMWLACVVMERRTARADRRLVVDEAEAIAEVAARVRSSTPPVPAVLLAAVVSRACDAAARSPRRCPLCSSTDVYVDCDDVCFCIACRASYAASSAEGDS